MDERLKALMRVQTYGFALDEAILFLDTHPNDRDALDYYHKAQAEYENAVKLYTTKFGPLEAKKVMSRDGWAWVEGCMPWEEKCNVEL